MEVRRPTLATHIDSRLTMEGSERGGGSSTRDGHYHKWVSFSQKGKADNGGFLEKGKFCASGKDAVTVDAQVTKNGFADDDDAYVDGSRGLSTYPRSVPVRFVGLVQGVPKKGPSWASIVEASSDDNSADADGVIVAVDRVALKAVVINDAAGAVTDVAGKAINADLGAVS